MEIAMQRRPGSKILKTTLRGFSRVSAMGVAAAGATPALLVVLAGGAAISAQDKYTVQVPNGLSFAEFRGYEEWQAIAVSQTDQTIEVILGNPAMIEGYRSGAPDNGKAFPDGAKMAKIHWTIKKSADAPAPTTVPDALHDIDFMVRDSKRFSATGNWGYAQFNYDAASDTFKPEGSGADCGYACHTIVQAKDYVFTAYPKR
jgi:Cytochrome P460